MDSATMFASKFYVDLKQSLKDPCLLGERLVLILPHVLYVVSLIFHRRYPNPINTYQT